MQVTTSSCRSDAIFSHGVGPSVAGPFYGARCSFLYEQATEPGPTVTVRRVEWVHPFWDLALLRVEGDELANRVPLSFEGQRFPLSGFSSRPVAVIEQVVAVEQIDVPRRRGRRRRVDDDQRPRAVLGLAERVERGAGVGLPVAVRVDEVGDVSLEARERIRAVEAGGLRGDGRGHVAAAVVEARVARAAAGDDVRAAADLGCHRR